MGNKCPKTEGGPGRRYLRNNRGKDREPCGSYLRSSDFLEGKRAISGSAHAVPYQ
jgi:hypothetical protein